VKIDGWLMPIVCRHPGGMAISGIKSDE